MKTLSLVITLLASSWAFAGTKTQALSLIKKNIEVTTFVEAFQKNRRGLICNKIDTSRITVDKNEGVHISIFCNEYDKDGMPMANVHFIEMSGQLYPEFFHLISIQVVAAE